MTTKDLQKLRIKLKLKRMSKSKDRPPVMSDFSDEFITECLDMYGSWMDTVEDAGFKFMLDCEVDE